MARFILLSFATAAMVLGLTACGESATAPESAPLSAFEASKSATAPSSKSIAEIADEEGFTLLLAAVNYVAATNPESELVARLLDEEQLTVFAPTDAAFEALVGAVSGLVDADVLASDGPFAAIDDLLGAGTIEAVLSYHVTEGRRAANSVVPRMAGQDRKISTLLEGASFTVNSSLQISAVGSSANIAAANVSASNGIIHVIDAVLLPVDLGL